jgi:ATP adenylyltransferase
VYQSAWWAVNHVVGPLNVGTLVLGRGSTSLLYPIWLNKLRRNSVRCCDATTQVIEALTAPEQTYVCMWSHGRVHWTSRTLCTPR